eukprot:2318578-Rhodomonas_salina.1
MLRSRSHTAKSNTRQLHFRHKVYWDGVFLQLVWGIPHEVADHSPHTANQWSVSVVSPNHLDLGGDARNDDVGLICARGWQHTGGRACTCP